MALTGATLGKACLTKNFGKIMLQNYRVGRFIPLNMETISKQFVYYSLTNPEFLNKMFSKINAGAQGNVGKADFIKLMIKLPSLQEQDKICHNLTSIDNLIDSEEQYLSKIKLLKQGLMHDLLSGKVDVKGLN
jgi:type I restriction enzyme S subunit